MSKQIDNYSFNKNDLLGIGQQGKVFKGVEKVTNRDVAIKVIQKSDFVDDEVLQKALLDEMQLMSKLKHQNIVQLLNVISSDTNYYVVYEFCKQDLQHQLKTQHKLPESTVIKLITDILQGFTEMIKQGIIHRDLKLTNILIHNDTYKLTDCGFTRTLENFTKSNTKEFNLFMSPQVLQGDKYTNKCDIWSLGVVIYNCIYGYTPWFGKKVEELLHNIQYTMLDFPEAQVKISRELQSFIDGCLSVDEESRFNWDDIYSHKLVQEHFKSYKSEIKEQQINFLMNDVRQKIVKQNIDIVKLFKELDQSGDQSLQFSEFVVLLKRIDPKMSRNDMQQIFKKLDLDGDKDISFEEFTKWLTQNNTKMTLLSGKFKGVGRGSLTNIDARKKTPPPIQQPFVQPAFGFVEDRIQQPQPVQVFQPNFNPQPPQPPQFQPWGPQFANPLPLSPQQSEVGFGSQNSIEKTILKIKQSIQKYNIDIYQLFVKYDRDGDSYLNFNEFGGLVNKISPKLPQEDVWQVFRIFDLNEDQYVSFIEFKQVLNLTVDKPPQQSWAQSMINPLTTQFGYYQQPQFQQAFQQQQQQFQQQPQLQQQMPPQQQMPQQQMMKTAGNQPYGQQQFQQPMDKSAKYQQPQQQIVQQLTGKPAQKNDQPKNPYAAPGYR